MQGEMNENRSDLEKQSVPGLHFTQLAFVGIVLNYFKYFTLSIF